MEKFGELLENLVYATARNAKLRLLVNYLKSAPDPDRGWALAALTNGLPFSLPMRRALQVIMARHIDPFLFRLSRDYVGDTAETAALLWPDPREHTPPSVTEAVHRAREAKSSAFPEVLADLLDRLDTKSRIALIKLFSGALRVGVSARLAKTAVAMLGERNVDEIEELWHGLQPPYENLFAWLEGGPVPVLTSSLSLKPVMLAHPIEDQDWPGLTPADVSAEWKWDGIRVQIAAGAGEARLFSRAGDNISAGFPDVVAHFAHTAGILDGELLVMRGGVVAPFNDLQQRLNRKSVTLRMMQDYPAHVRLYDILFDGEMDVRPLPLRQRRDILERWLARERPQATDLSHPVVFSTFEELREIWQNTRDAGIEGLMLKRLDSPYLAGRQKGHWFKWKRAPLTLDCVLMYAQRGSGKRSSFYSDFTFGVWDGPTLVPVGKSYSGFTDAELSRLDRFVRANTIERFGPVRSVKPELVLEIAFDAVQASKRHKSGVAMRFPRIQRIRWDKPANEADTLDTIRTLIVSEAGPREPASLRPQGPASSA
jgi:DNA ligase-1